MNKRTRLQRLRQKFAENRIEAVWISGIHNLHYLSGCPGLEGYLLVTEQNSIIATDFRYVEQAERQSPDCQIFRISGKMAEWLPSLFADLDIHRLGFESDHLSCHTFSQLTEIFKNAGVPVELIPTVGLTESIRVIKEPEETEKISRAARITAAALAHVEKVLRPGMSELELAWEIEKFMRENGSQPVPFPLIVAAGPNSALPHAVPSDYVIQAGEPVIVDIGSKFESYGSDLTRTFYIGEPDAAFRKIYRTVLDAQQTAISQIKSGMTGLEADSIARDIISRAGYGEAFGHSLGHGIGLVTHENPRLGPASTDVLSDGMVFTIEPGIYISGWGGVRIEDDVILENGTIRKISSAGYLDI